MNFLLSYGINGGPNWTLRRFKGPSGGGGGSSGSAGGSSSGGGGGGGGGQLANINRSDTDSLTITFVAACQDSQVLTPTSYWDTLPVCDSYGLLKGAAANAGAYYNTLSLSGKGLQ